jgi:gas vesicle protein
MKDDNNRVEVASAHNHEAKHPFVLGVLTGAAIGAGVALLFAPRTGAQMRHEIGHQWTRAKGNCSTGYHRAKDVAGHWSERGRHAYDVTRTKVAHGARETRQYVREVSDALTRRAHKEAHARANEKEFAVISR